MVEMEAFTGKLHSYLLSVGAKVRSAAWIPWLGTSPPHMPTLQIEDLHTRMERLDGKLTDEVETQAARQAEDTRRLDERLTRRTEVWGGGTVPTVLVTGCC